MGAIFDSGIQFSAITLSGGGLIATSTGNGLAVSTKTLTGLTYAEMTCTTAAGTMAVGVVGVNWNFGAGTDLTSIMYLSTGVVRFNNVTQTTLSTYTSADRIGIAIDWLNKLIWFRKNGGNWNGSALNDPATGVGGISFAVPSGTNGNTGTGEIGTGKIGINAPTSGGVWTANYSGAFTDTVPTGYSSIDTNQMTTAFSVASGAVPTGFLLPAVNFKAPLGTDNKGCINIGPAGAVTKVSGTILETGVTAGGKRVDVYDRLTGELLGTAFSASDGTWSLACLGRPSVRVVADDPTTYNSLVYDNVVPV